MTEAIVRSKEDADMIHKAVGDIYTRLRELPSPIHALDAVSMISAMLVYEYSKGQDLQAAFAELFNSIQLQYAQYANSAREDTLQ